MERKEYEKMMEQLKTAFKFAKDYCNVQRCETTLEDFEREQAVLTLRDLIHEYRNLINTYGFLFDGVHVIDNMPISKISDEALKMQIRYIKHHIPAYAFLRDGQEELAKKINAWLNKEYGIPMFYMV